MEKLIQFISANCDKDTSRLILDRKKYPDIDIDLAVNCIESRRKLKGKVQEWHEEPRLIFPLKLSAEQCSSSATGAYKAQVAEAIAVRSLDCARDDRREGARDNRREWTIADLTGGLGVDSWFFSKKAAKVIYNEMQTPLCQAASLNFKTLGTGNIEIINSTAAQGNIGKITGDRVDIVYMDPARRGEGGKKVFLIEDCTPDVLTLRDEIFRYTDNILIKLSPMADISMVCDRLGPACREVHVISTAGECKELLIWMNSGWKEEYTIIATELHNNAPAAQFIFKPSEERSATCHACITPGRTHLLFEPGKALMKAGAYNLIAQRYGLDKLGKSTHYYLAESAQEADMLKPYGKVFSIIECQPLSKQSIREFGKRYPKSEVTARNIPMDTETLRKKSGITSGDDAHIFGLKSDRDGNILIAAKRVF